MFYLTLPSNSSLKYYPDNTLSKFTTQLAQPIALSGSWEVGLAEVQYPHSWHNIEEAWILYESASGFGLNLSLPSGLYDTPQQLIEELNALITARKRQHHVKFSYQPVTQKVSVSVTGGGSLEMSQNLQELFGMTSMPVRGKVEGKKVLDVKQGFDSLYIYCNIIEPRLVGDSEVPLLRIVPIEGQHGMTVTKIYNQIQYLPVLQKNFNSLEINIRKDTGELVPFESGKLVVTLHFREKKPYY